MQSILSTDRETRGRASWKSRKRASSAWTVVQPCRRLRPSVDRTSSSSCPSSFSSRPSSSSSPASSSSSSSSAFASICFSAYLSHTCFFHSVVSFLLLSLFFRADVHPACGVKLQSVILSSREIKWQQWVKVRWHTDRAIMSTRHIIHLFHYFLIKFDHENSVSV